MGRWRSGCLKGLVFVAESLTGSLHRLPLFGVRCKKGYLAHSEYRHSECMYEIGVCYCSSQQKTKLTLSPEHLLCRLVKPFQCAFWDWRFSTCLKGIATVFHTRRDCRCPQCSQSHCERRQKITCNSCQIPELSEQKSFEHRSSDWFNPWHAYKSECALFYFSNTVKDAFQVIPLESGGCECYKRWGNLKQYFHFQMSSLSAWYVNKE